MIEKSKIKLKKGIAFVLATLQIGLLVGCNKPKNDKEINQEEVVEETLKRFEIGEHIISVPVNVCYKDIDVRFFNCQYEYHPGYEIIGIDVDNLGSWVVLLYQNTTPVMCKLEDKGYTSFGTPIELEETKTR